MTARDCYDAILIEINKTDTPDILLEEFNYLFNKAINQFVNKSYNKYDINQQSTDDLRVLKATSLLTPTKCKSYGLMSSIGRMMGATYEVILPQDYLHILNCICIYSVEKTTKCYNRGDIWRRLAERLTADKYSQILDNMWLKPTYKRPYYYIHNVNIEDRIIQPTDPIGIYTDTPAEGREDNDPPGGDDNPPGGGGGDDNPPGGGGGDDNPPGGGGGDDNPPGGGDSNIFYVGTTEPTTSNYQNLLDNYGRTSLNNYEYETIGNSVYVIIPSNGSLNIIGKNTGGKIATYLSLEYNGYKFYETNLILAPIIVTATGSVTTRNVSLRSIKLAATPTTVLAATSTTIETTPTVTEQNKIKTGTDFYEGSLTLKYKNRIVTDDEKGLEKDLGTDAFGNKIFLVEEGKGVATNMLVNLGKDESGNYVYDNASLVERSALVRYGNSSLVRMEIRYGTDDTVFKLTKVYIDYIKAPQHIRLTQEQLDLTEDTSQMLEFPDYVCQEIVNELVHLIMENTANQRLLTHPVVSLSIANPTQQLTTAPRLAN